MALMTAKERVDAAKSKASAADNSQGTGGLLTSKVDVAAKALLTKKVNPAQVFQVVAMIDKSYSMDDEYRNGDVQRVVERALGFSAIVDDDGEVPAVFFGGNIDDKHTIKLNDCHEYIDRNGIRPDGGTPMASAIRKVAEITGNGDLFHGGHFGRSAPAPSVKKAETPAFVIAVTDGAPNPDERQATIDAIQRLSFRPVFFKFLYVGHDEKGWKFLKGLDDDIEVGKPYEQGGRLIDNVDAQQMATLAGMSDKDFYELMFEEVAGWLNAAKANGLI